MPPLISGTPKYVAPRSQESVHDLTLYEESYFTYSGQDESPIDHNVHWRPGIGADGSETFLPRTVVYDLKGGFGSLRKINALYEAESASDHASSSLW
jgi:hypothetical protein